MSEHDIEVLAVLEAIGSTQPYATQIRTLLELSDAGLIAAAINVRYSHDRWILTTAGKVRMTELQKRRQEQD